MPTPDGSIWWEGVLEASIKHTVGVSQDLREGIRRSIEVIANDVLDRRRAAGLGVDDIDGQVLARQSLRFLYRILFLLYAEASPEMGVLPVGAGEYNEGYGLDRLRELTLVSIQSPGSRRGTHIYDSLARLFHLVDNGHAPAGANPSEDASGENEGLVFQPLKADLFHDAATSLINGTKLSNAALQRVLQHLLLSKEAKGKDRGFISYAELGINQLGAVYEGLMSYTGFIAAEPLHEVAKDGNPEKGSWVVAVDWSESIDAKHFVVEEDERTGERRPVLHPAGSFVFRLAGRERQQSASYYTPEVLTKFVVSQALEELLDQNDQTTAADDILNLTVCEPALGSGAFALEAVRQLADEYLKRKQDELDVRIPADEYSQELQKVKAQIALHQVHGVDLNSTAVELAEVSLWLDTMVKDLQAPWFGLRLRRGNSLIGSRRATYSRQSVNDKSWLKSAPQDAPLIGLVEAMTAETDDPNVVGRIHHFLLPADGWGAAADAKEVKDLAGEAQQELKAWRSKIKSKPSKTQVDRMVNLGRRVESLWKLTLRRLQVAETEARRDIDYFGKRPPAVRSVESIAVTREQIEQSLDDENGSYQRLRRVMDAWNALWFWPLTERETGGIKPPSLEEWISALEGILGIESSAGKTSRKYGLIEGQTSILSMASWGELEAIESFDLSTAQAKSIGTVKVEHAWLGVCEQVATDQGFFHWELDFASVFSRGGFDLQVGNPPWVRPEWDENAVMAEFDPWWMLKSPSEEGASLAKRAVALSDANQRQLVLAEAASLTGIRAFSTDPTFFPGLAGLHPELYRCFMILVWRNATRHGVAGLIHPAAHVIEERAAVLRSMAYRHLSRFWHFTNELRMFEIGNTRPFAVNIYGGDSTRVDFRMSAGLFHPETVERSLRHDDSGPIPGIKTADGNWDRSPHRSRIFRVTDELLSAWNRIAGDCGAPATAKMTFPISSVEMSVLEKLSTLPRLGALAMGTSPGWQETSDRKRGYFERRPARVTSWRDVVLQGPHITVNNPLFKQPNVTLKSHRDWSPIDLLNVSANFIPRTGYQRAREEHAYDLGYTQLTSSSGAISAREFYRVAWRRMGAGSSVRTLHVAMIPPGAAHIHGVYSLALPDEENDNQLSLTLASMSSLVMDFWVRANGITELNFGAIRNLPHPEFESPFMEACLVRVLRLNCMTNAYSQLWEHLWDESWNQEEWAPTAVSITESLGTNARQWTPDIPLRGYVARRQAGLEIDVLVALAAGLTVDELVAIYRSRFPVLQRYDGEIRVDLHGEVLGGSAAGALDTDEDDAMAQPLISAYSAGEPDRSASFVLDREEDMRKAYTHFSNMLGDKTS